MKIRFLILVLLLTAHCPLLTDAMADAPEVKIKVDDRQVRGLSKDLSDGIRHGLFRITERGTVILREEVPKETHNLAQGVSGDVNTARMEAKLLVSARSGRRGSRSATLHLPGGGTRQITLKASPAFDYAEAVARGTGVFGPRGQVIKPKGGKALLIPVSTVPAGESYIEAGGQRFVVRRFTKGRRANPYDERAAVRLERDAQPIFDKAIDAAVNKSRA